MNFGSTDGIAGALAGCPRSSSRNPTATARKAIATAVRTAFRLPFMAAPAAGDLFLEAADVLDERLEFVVGQTFGRFHPHFAFRVLQSFLERLKRFLVLESFLDFRIGVILDAELLAHLGLR